MPFRIPSPPFPAADTTHWSEFTPEHAASPELLAQFTAACAAKSVMVNAAANAKGAVVITKATRSAGAPASVVPWDVVKAVARTVFGHCTSVAAVKGGAPRPISTNTPLPPPPVPRLNAAHSVPFRIPSPPFPAADTTHWSEFTPEHAASPELLAQFTAACAAKSVMVNAAANAKGAVVITKATRSAGAPASVVPWDVVKAVARTVFGHCTSVAAVKGGRATIESHGEQMGNCGRKSASDYLDEILSCSLLTPLLAHAQVPKGKTT